MRCDEARRLIVMADAVGYGTPRRGGLKKHLRGCGVCREAAQDVRREGNVLRAAFRDLEIDPGFEAGVWARIDGGRSGPGSG